MTEPAPTSSPAPSGTIVYGDVPNRIIAYIIDAIVIGIINIIVATIVGAFGITAVTIGTDLSITYNWLGTIILTVLGLVITGAYFVYLWTTRRATVGMQVLGLQIGTAPDGATITTEQAIKRYLALGAIFSLAQILNPLPLVGLIIAVASLAWVIFLLYTTANSPTKQGWHDVFANTMIVKTVK
jgi:uncharacterized RDD family membrane protein YckC